MSFYNTVNASNEELSNFNTRVLSQEEKILTFFSLCPGQCFSPSEIHRLVDMNGAPITSTRRSITDLTKKGFLIKTSKQMRGLFDVLEFKWVLK